MTETVANPSTEFVTTGRRKTATARVRLKRGSGQIMVNGKTLKEYFRTDQLIGLATGPIATTDLKGELDINATVEGSGPAGQAIAVAHGIARGLQKMNPELRALLKPQGHLRRDPRARERKKPGRPGARKRFQFSKR
jgi:small subunit ribosomal protein S9